MPRADTKRWVKVSYSGLMLTCGTKSWEESWTVKVGTWLRPTKCGYEWYMKHIFGETNPLFGWLKLGVLCLHGDPPNGYLMPGFFDVQWIWVFGSVPWQPIACRWCRSDPIRRLWSSWNRCYAKINSQKQYNKSHRKWCEHHMTATTGV